MRTFDIPLSSNGGATSAALIILYAQLKTAPPKIPIVIASVAINIVIKILSEESVEYPRKVRNSHEELQLLVRGVANPPCERR